MNSAEITAFCDQLQAVTESWWTGDLFIEPDPHGWIAVYNGDMDTAPLYDAIMDMIAAWDKVNVEDGSYTEYRRP